MFKHEIDSLFTAKVTEYLSKGYHIHTRTMGGSQGEVAHIDLTNGVELLRVLLDRQALCFLRTSYAYKLAEFGCVAQKSLVMQSLLPRILKSNMELAHSL